MNETLSVSPLKTGKLCVCGHWGIEHHVVRNPLGQHVTMRCEPARFVTNEPLPCDCFMFLAHVKGK